jgi:nucleotide-binding universal stress UspA family protein
MKVLLATDGSSHAELAEAIGSKIPKYRNGEWTAVTVVSPIGGMLIGVEPLGAPMITEDLQRLFEASLRRGTNVLSETVRRLNSKGIRAKSELLEGDPVAELCALAKEGDFDVILIGHRGIGGLSGLVLGSVAKAMVSKCPCSVLIARSRPDATDDQVREAISLLDKFSVGIGYDGSKGAQIALETVRDQGDSVFSEIFAICAHPIAVVPAGIDASDLGELIGDSEGAAITCVRSAEEQLKGTSLVISGGTGLGSASDVLCGFAQAKNLDLLVLGANRHGMWERLLLGSTSMDIVKHSPCSVWIVRPSKDIV